jgi:hypothetical protein
MENTYCPMCRAAQEELRLRRDDIRPHPKAAAHSVHQGEEEGALLLPYLQTLPKRCNLKKKISKHMPLAGPHHGKLLQKETEVSEESISKD